MILAGLAAVGLWWMGGAVGHGLAISAAGVATVGLAMLIRGPEEQGANGLMLVGTLLAIGGIIFIVVKGVSGVAH
jgi:hypothetical protein